MGGEGVLAGGGKDGRLGVFCERVGGGLKKRRREMKRWLLVVASVLALPGCEPGIFARVCVRVFRNKEERICWVGRVSG